MSAFGIFRSVNNRPGRFIKVRVADGPIEQDQVIEWKALGS